MSGSRLCVLTGCQMEGLVAALRVLLPDWTVEGFHTYRLLGEDRETIRAEVLASDVLFALPMEPHFGEFAHDAIHKLGPPVHLVPPVVFAAFHPDVTYVERHDGSRVQTPMTDYNSTIAAAAYLNGLDLDRTRRLFNAYTYQALGWFDLIEDSRRSLIADFDGCNMDLRASLDTWLQTPEPFMYSMNHPRIDVLADVAVAAARAAGFEVGPSTAALRNLPDRLAEWVVYPVYKEIAARAGKVGSDTFKLCTGQTPDRLSLAEYLERSFARYAEEDVMSWKISDRIAEAREVLGRLTRRSTPAAARAPSVAVPAVASIYAEPRTIRGVDECFFYHTTDLPEHGTQIGPWDLRGRFSDYIGGFDVAGLRVLDVGAASGFLSFAAEEAGAAEVVSFDLDSADRQHLLPFAGSEYVTDHSTWSRKQTAAFQRWKNAYWLTHRLRGSTAKVVYGDVYKPPEAIGQFDVVILGAILEHLADPIRALAGIATHARSTIVINTDLIDSEAPIARFNGHPDRPDASYIFWTYSLGTFRSVMAILGFEITAVRRHRFIARDASGDIVEAERVALVCSRLEQPAEAALRKVA